MTTYEIIHGNMECPLCGKILIEQEFTDQVYCRDSNCKFNKDTMTELLDITNKNTPNKKRYLKCIKDFSVNSMLFIFTFVKDKIYEIKFDEYKNKYYIQIAFSTFYFDESKIKEYFLVMEVKQ